MSVQDLKNWQVLVTGAGSEIGRARALAFARRGTHIIASDTSQAALDAVPCEVKLLGVRCATYVVDGSSEAAMPSIAQRVDIAPRTRFFS
jgi:NAD(P)-dependent dehydrogenase (short-subunit alcohol dehydrogenase family)